MGSSLYPVSYLAVLATILVASNVGVQAKRTIRIQSLDKVTEDTTHLRSHLRIAESEENEFKVDGYLDLTHSLDNDWTVVLKVLRSPDGDADFEKVLTLEMQLCDFMKSYYKDIFYERIKGYSNAPHPGSCPLPKERYVLEDYPFKVKVLKKLMTPGFYLIKYSLKNEETKILSYVLHIELEED
ncbi:uncharacterized protein LOC6553588 [Drosophila erecta]|uniref:GG19621 n=1 Tax=Drosophila erecta TaxID=7220 RepID=B3P153_DROER|nr:uncharacterized protein LOC6553588 [Drosophila erecta]EDV49242.1 uncharacterized protein Dere_GG19621 [Drosophila erecta]